MKNLNAINELLNEVVTSRGMEDELTIELFRMKDRGESYEMIKEYKKLYEGAEKEDWFGFDY